MTDPLRQRRPRLFLFAAVAYAALIFAVSQIPGKELERIGVDIWDKALHAAEYLPLGALVMGFLVARREAAAGAAPWRDLVVALGIALAYGASDELHQAFVPGRHSAWTDVAADAVGGALGAAVALIVGRRSAGRRLEPLDELDAREDEQPVELLSGDPGDLSDRRDRE